MQRVIGLDIGSYSIKAVEILNTLKSYEIVNFYENVIPHLDGVPMDAVAPSCMEQLFRENNLEADRIVTAMPGQFISSRVVTLGFSDPRKVEASVYAEVEDAVPFNMDDMIIDHQILGSVTGKTIALAVMTRKAFLKNFLDLLQRINIDPKLVDVDSLAFYNLSSYMRAEPGRCFGMVDIGHEKTSVCIVKDGVLRMFRSINLGGRYITEFLARDLETSFQDAQRIKHRVSRVLSQDNQANDVSGDEKIVIERTTLAANAIIKELGRTLYAFKSWEKEPLSHLYISGGTSKIKNLVELIQDQLEVPAELCRLDQTELKISPDLTEHQYVMPQGVAIGMRTVSSIKKHSQVNLRRGEFAYVQNYESFLKAAVKGLQVIAIAIVLLIFSYGFKYWIYSSHISDLQAQYKREFLQMAGTNQSRFQNPQTFTKLVSDSKGYLNSRLQDMRRGLEIFSKQNGDQGPLILLKQISESVPKSVLVDVTLYEFKTIEGGDGRLTIRAETEGYASQSEFIEALRKVPNLEDVTETQSGQKPGKSNIIEFTVTAKYPMELGAVGG